MKKLRLIAMFALTFALVFGVASCKNEEEEGPWGESLAEVLKAEPKLDLSGKWKVFEGDGEIELDGPDAAVAYFQPFAAMFDALTGEEKAKFICEEFLELESEYNSTGNDFAEMLIAKEADMKKDKDQSFTVLINGDRDQIRIEFEAEYKDGKTTISASGYVTYEKK